MRFEKPRTMRSADRKRARVQKLLAERAELALTGKRCHRCSGTGRANACECAACRDGRKARDVALALQGKPPHKPAPCSRCKGRGLLPRG